MTALEPEVARQPAAPLVAYPRPGAQWLCVEGFGPNFRPYPDNPRSNSSSTMPGSTERVLRSASTDRRWWQYLAQSVTTAVFVHWPPRLVPPPRESTGAPNRAYTSTAAAPTSRSRGTTTPIGTWRWFDPSVAYAPRLPASKRTVDPVAERALQAARIQSGRIGPGPAGLGAVCVASHLRHPPSARR